VHLLACSAVSLDGWYSTISITMKRHYAIWNNSKAHRFLADDLVFIMLATRQHSRHNTLQYQPQGGKGELFIILREDKASLPRARRTRSIHARSCSYSGSFAAIGPAAAAVQYSGTEPRKVQRNAGQTIDTG
jgi:hypothetical protein